MTGLIFKAEYTQDMNNRLVTQMYEQINVAFHPRPKNDCYKDNMKCETNVALNHNNEIIDCKNELFDYMIGIKIRYEYFLIFTENEKEYVTVIGMMCMTSIHDCYFY